MSPMIAIGFSLQFFFVRLMIARIIPARPVNTLKAFANMTHAKLRVTIPNINAVIAVPLDCLG